VTKHIGEISFESPAVQGDVVEFGLETKSGNYQGQSHIKGIRPKIIKIK
jgi:acyl-CoA hydrolase